MTVAAAQVLRSARVARTWDETPRLRGLTVEPDGGVTGHAAPGQYVKIAASPGVEGFFALANPPGREPIELLVKRGAPVADALASLAPGDAVAVTQPLGRGYPVAEHEGHDLVLFAAGSGIAPIRAVVEHVARDRARYGAVRLYHGQRTRGDFAYAGDEAAWRDAAVDVVRVLSGDDPEWSGARGHVQDVFRRDAGSLERAVFYVCGMKPMIAGVGEVLAELGIDRARMYLNY